MGVQAASNSSLSPLFNSWIDEKTSVKIYRGKVFLGCVQPATKTRVLVSIKAIEHFIQDVDTSYPKNLPLLHLVRFKYNLIKLNQHIECHNASIDKTLLKRILNFFLHFFGCTLKCRQLKIPELIQRSTPAQQEGLIKELTENLEAADRHDFLCDALYLLTRISRLSSPLLQNVLQKLHLIWPTAENCGLDRLTTFKIATFIESNRELIHGHRIGIRSKSRGCFHIRHIKPDRYNTPLLIEYNEQEKTFLVYASELYEGVSKKPKCVIDYESNTSWVVAKIHNTRQLDPANFRALCERERKITEEFKDEACIVKISRYFEYFSEKKQTQACIFIMPFYNQGSLSVLLKSHKMERYDKLTIARDILEGLFALRKHGVIHRDIKPGNIFVHKTEDTQGKFHYNAVIGDLGLSIKKTSSISHKTCGTKLFYSPEVVKGSPQSEASDLWALALTLHQLFHGTFIIEGKKDCEEKLKELETLSLKLPITTHDPLLNSVLKMLVYAPQQRLLPEQIYAEVCEELKGASL